MQQHQPHHQRPDLPLLQMGTVMSSNSADLSNHYRSQYTTSPSQNTLPTPPSSATGTRSTVLVPQQYDMSPSNSVPGPFNASASTGVNLPRQAHRLVSVQSANAVAGPSNLYPVRQRPPPGVQTTSSQYQTLSSPVHTDSQSNQLQGPGTSQNHYRPHVAEQPWPSHFGQYPQTAQPGSVNWMSNTVNPPPPKTHQPHPQRRHTIDVSQQGYAVVQAQPDRSFPVEQHRPPSAPRPAQPIAEPSDAFRRTPTSNSSGPSQPPRPRMPALPGSSTSQPPNPQGQAPQRPPSPPSYQPSSYAMQHSGTLLRQSAQCLEQSFVVAQKTVAMELERLNTQFMTLKADNKELTMKNKSLSDEKERILKEHNAQAAICDTLARERHSAIEGEAKAKEALAALKDQTRQVVVFCKYYQTKHKEVTDQLAGSNEEIARVKSVNEAFARLSFQHTGTCAAEEGSESAGKDLAAGEMKFKQIGSFTVPEALSTALEQTVMKDLSDSFEERLAQVMLHQMAERPKYEKEIAVLRARLRSYEGNSSTSPALSPTLARSSIAMPVTPSSPLSPLVRRSVPPSNAHPPTPPAEHILASSLSRIRTLSSTEVSQPSRPSADAEHITPDTPQTTPSLPIPRHALPTPTPVASAPSSSTCNEEDLFTKIKQEDAGVIVPNWPWKRGEIIDLTEYLDDADEPVDTPQIDLRELEMELNAALTETDSPEPAEKTPISDAPTVGSEKKRTLEDDQLDGGDDPARKRMRVDDVQDVEMADGGQGDIDRPSDDSSGLVGGPFEGVADTTDHVMGPPATYQQPEVLQISTGSVPNGDVSRTVADDGLLANKAPVGVEPTTEILATTGAHTPLRISNSLRSTAEAEADDRSYCHCKKPPCGVMIACDDPGCAIEWFHLPCADLVEPPAGEWFCKDCSALGRDPDLPIDPHRTELESIHASPPQETGVEIKKETIESLAPSFTILSADSCGRDSKTEPGKLSSRHLELVYNTCGDRMTCRMCVRRKEDSANWEVAVFSSRASWADLIGHCETVHPAGYKNLLKVPLDKVEEVRKQLLEK